MFLFAPITIILRIRRLFDVKTVQVLMIVLFYQDQGGVPKGIRGMTWVPNVKIIILILQHYGATLQSVLPNEIKTAGILPIIHDAMKTEETLDTLTSTTSCNPHLVFVMGKLIQFLTHCLHMAPLKFTVNDLHLLLVISCRLSLDLRLQQFLFDIEMLIFEVLNCFGESQWEEQVSKSDKAQMLNPRVGKGEKTGISCDVCWVMKNLRKLE